MSEDSYNLSEVSKLIDNDDSGHQLAQYLMKRKQAPKIDRIFGDKERRITIPVEVTKAADKEQTNEAKQSAESQNTENLTEIEANPAAPLSPRRQITSPLRVNNAAENVPLSTQQEKLNSKPNVVAVSSVHQVLAPLTPVYDRLAANRAPQTPKSSQQRACISPSDRLRRMSFKHLNAVGAKRVLLADLNATEDSNQFSQFEPSLQNRPGCTSTPAIRNSAPEATKNAAIVALGHANREYTITKGPVQGQIILTPAHLAAHQSPRNTIWREEQIDEATIQNVNVTYSPCAHVLTDNNPISIIMTDDEDDDQAVEENDNVSVAKTARNSTFVRPRTPPMRKKSTKTTSFAQRDSLLVNEVQTPADTSGKDICDTGGENGDDECTTFQSTVPLPICIQTSVKTEIFDDATDLDEVTFDNNNANQKLQKRFPRKRRTPEYIRTYKNATKKFKVKIKKMHLQHSKRSLYSMKESETIVESSPSNCEVTSTNVNATSPALRSECGEIIDEQNRRAPSSNKTVLDNKHKKRNPTSKKIDSERTPEKESCAEEELEIPETQEPQRVTRSILNNKNKKRNPTSKKTTSQQTSEKEPCTEEELEIPETQEPQRVTRSRTQKKVLNKSRTPRLRQSSSSSSSSRSASRSPCLIHRSASPPLSGDQASSSSSSEPQINTKSSKRRSRSRKASSEKSHENSSSRSSTRSPCLLNKSAFPPPTAVQALPSACVQSSKRRSRSRASSKRKRKQNSSTSSSRSVYLSPCSQSRSASPQYAADQAPTLKQTEIQPIANPLSQQASPQFPSQKSPARSRRKNQVREDSPTKTVLTKNNKKGRPKTSKKPTTKLASADPLSGKSSALSSATEQDCPYRRSQRERKPTKIEPYAIEIYTRAYFPDRMVKNPKKNNVKKAKKRKSQKDPENLQPVVKLRRLNPNSEILNNNGNENNIINRDENGVDNRENAIVTWLLSNTASENNGTSALYDTNVHNNNGNFMSRELMIGETHKDIEFRIYNHPAGPSLGFVIFKPKAVKKMVTLKHSGVRFVCLNGRFKFKIITKNSTETKEYICAVADAFIVNIGDKYCIENMEENEYSQLIMIKERIINDED